MYSDPVPIGLRMRYGRLQASDPRGGEPISWRPTEVLDDLLGLTRDEKDLGQYLPYLAKRYAPILLPGASKPTGKTLLGLAPTDWWRGAGHLVFGAVQQAAGGRMAFAAYGNLAIGLQALRWRSDGEIEIDESGDLRTAMPKKGLASTLYGVRLAALVALCLLEVIQEGPVTWRWCENCGLPWIAEPGVRFCDRPAPGRRTSCRKVRAQRRFAHRAPGFLLERKRLLERAKRGRTLTLEEYRHWLSENRPGAHGKTWVTLDEWRAGKRPKTKGGRNDGNHHRTQDQGKA